MKNLETTIWALVLLIGTICSYLFGYTIAEQNFLTNPIHFTLQAVKDYPALASELQSGKGDIK